ncbi:MAG: ribosome silencing factor [Acidobacteriota bacterium]
MRSRLPGSTRRKHPPESDSAAAVPPTPAPGWLVAAQAAESKKAIELRVLDVQGVTSFADYFVICSGANPRQIQAIADEVELRLKQEDRLPLGVEGYDHAEWVLVDYGDFLVHIFSASARTYYDLERLWRQAKEVELAAAP